MRILPDSLLLPECIYRPGSFSGLMVLYESNYVKLIRLTGVLNPGESHWISRVRQDHDLHLERLRTEPYTSTLRMSYWLRDGASREFREPDFLIRIYLDAGQAEASAPQSPWRYPAIGTLLPRHSQELDRRWRRNMMLNKWLDYLLDRGHGFS